jgi:formaldehyde-activating enzyme involved in methanogenesis
VLGSSLQETWQSDATGTKLFSVLEPQAESVPIAVGANRFFLNAKAHAMKVRGTVKQSLARLAVQQITNRL